LTFILLAAITREDMGSSEAFPDFVALEEITVIHAQAGSCSLLPLLKGYVSNLPAKHFLKHG